MPTKCVILNCPMRQGRDPVDFYRFPVVPKRSFKWKQLAVERLNAWLSATRRQDLFKTIHKKNSNVTVCSRHFISGKSADLHDTTNPDWVPSLCLSGQSSSSEKEKVAVVNGTGVWSKEIQGKATPRLVSDVQILNDITIVGASPPITNGLSEQKTTFSEEEDENLEYISSDEEELAEEFLESEDENPNSTNEANIYESLSESTISEIEDYVEEDIEHPPPNKKKKMQSKETSQPLKESCLQPEEQSFSNYVAYDLRKLDTDLQTEAKYKISKILYDYNRIQTKRNRNGKEK